MNEALYGEVLVETIHTTSGRCVVLEAIAPGLEPVEGAGLSILLSAERAALLIDQLAAQPPVSAYLLGKARDAANLRDQWPGGGREAASHATKGRNDV